MDPMAPELDSAFQALGNATRRAVIQRLAKGSATVSTLAEPFPMALPSFLQHIRVLEEAGLVRSEKRGRVRTVEVVPERFRPASDWLRHQRSIWSRRLDQLDEYVRQLENDG